MAGILIEILSLNAVNGKFEKIQIQWPKLGRGKKVSGQSEVSKRWMTKV